MLQAVLAGGSRASWQHSARALSARDLAMNVALPEVDGRVLTRAVAFKHRPTGSTKPSSANIVSHEPEPDRVVFVADSPPTGRGWRERRAGERRVALVLANYPNRDGRLGNGVGLDTPAGRGQGRCGR